MKKYKILYILILSIALVSCEPFVEKVDEFDPTSPRDADLALVMTAMEVEYQATMGGEMARTAGMWSGYYTGSDRQYIPLFNYTTTAGDYDSPWGNVYAFTAKQAKIAQAKAAAANNQRSLAVCQIIEAHIMGTAAALWGDIPYREAFDHVQFPNPKYDPQAQVIDDVIVLLDKAIVNLNSGVGTFDGEFIGTGNTTSTANTAAQVTTASTRWLKGAHSLKARYLLYKKDYANALAEANLGIDVTANNIMGLYGTTNDQNRNVFYDFHERQRPGYMTAKGSFLAKKLNSAVPASYRGNSKTNESGRFTNYYSGSDPNYDIAVASGRFFGSATPQPLITVYETKLIAAECQARLNGVAAGVTALNVHRALLATAFPTGIYTAYVTADFAPGGIENKDNITDINALYREIFEEKYVSLYGQIEVFNEIRRIQNAIGLIPNAGSQIPQRFLYSQNEVNANSSTPNPIPELFTKTSIFQ
jgi:hypothetical protein